MMLCFFKLRDDKYTFLFGSDNTNKVFLSSTPIDFIIFKKELDFGISKLKSSKTIIEFSLALIDKADFRAKRLTFLLTF